jgi:hypothetical protein
MLQPNFPLFQGNVCQGNGRGPRLDYSPDNHSPDISPALPISMFILVAAGRAVFILHFAFCILHFSEIRGSILLGCGWPRCSPPAAKAGPPKKLQKVG